MIDRSPELCLVAFFLSKFGHNTNGKTNPPEELEVAKWNEAYRLFYENLNAGRTIMEFQNTLNNARDGFDSHIQGSERAGWKDKQGRPSPLTKVSQAIMEKFGNLERTHVWEYVKVFVGKKVANKVFIDLQAIQESERNDEVFSKTEGGRIVVTSFRYERKPSLREDAYKAHGCSCSVCGFNFEKAYGEWGRDFIEVHHIEPLASGGGRSRKIDPKVDLIVLCSNCHRMVHRRRGLTLTIEELRAKLTPEYTKAISLLFN
ncbi:HNH endonuclease [Mucilaginibacter rubeus]|uniref:HNH nuclease domain-containing protein n=1 Tax=Mucilaginibacter rubeus TaxID=2027860 RepID=A0A5C1HTY1_9SPHI|nr:HNH endonuclease [Mucilaginibacter rubeus]QEM09075.1 hypothetical protein DEO27_003260 [Mucilaginibacter rubeus]